MTVIQIHLMLIFILIPDLDIIIKQIFKYISC